MPDLTLGLQVRDDRCPASYPTVFSSFGRVGKESVELGRLLLDSKLGGGVGSSSQSFPFSVLHRVLGLVRIGAHGQLNERLVCI